jgi:hypothetical protein
MRSSPAMAARPANQPARGTERENGPENAATPDRTLRAGPPPADPAATALVDSMLVRIERSASASTVIDLGQVRNQSRCGAGEFAKLRARLAEKFTSAARDARVRFTADADPSSSRQPDYHLQGSAYLITSEGFDVWELFLSLTPARQNWTIWESDGPVHVLRLPRPGQPEILSK